MRVKLIAFPEELMKIMKKRRGVKDNSEIFGLSNWSKKVFIFELKREYNLRGRLGVQHQTC